MHTDYRSPVMKQLRDQQARYAPRQKKLEQVEQAEQFLQEVMPEKTYPYELLCFRITGYRPESRASGDDGGRGRAARSAAVH